MDASMIATIAVVVFLLIFLISGFCRGFLRVVLSALSIVLALVLTGVFAPMLADYAENSTAIGERVRQRIEEYSNDKLSYMTGSADEIEERFLDSLPITESMREEVKSGFDVSQQLERGTAAFSRSISAYLTKLIIRLISYVLLFIVIMLVLKLILKLSNLVNHIPLLGGINRAAGAIVGLAEGVVFLWIISMIIMILSGTDLGTACEETISGSRFLTFIHEHNYLMNIVNAVTGLFKVPL